MKIAVLACVLGLASFAHGQVVTPLGGGQSRQPVPFASPKLVNSPSAMTVTQLGSVQQLRVFVESGGVQTEVTAAPGTTYQSTNNAIVTVTASGLMHFVAQGQAQVLTQNGGLTDATDVSVDPTGLVMVETTIGPAGGTLSTGDGTGLEFPPGALANSHDIRIEGVVLSPAAVPPHNGALVGQAYEFTPSGLAFGADVQMAIAYDPATLPPTFDSEAIYVAIVRPDGTLAAEIAAGPDGQELLVETPTLATDDPAGGRILMPIRHFSERTLVIGKGAVAATLTAPDGTNLDILTLTKTHIPGKGPDGKYGRPNCDDDGDNTTDNSSEFRGAGGLCPGVIDDVAAAVSTRPLGNIAHIVLHSTASPANQSFARLVEVTAQDTCAYWAQYYVGLDGTIVQVSGDNTEAQHVVGNGTVNNNNSIGIEIFHQVPTENYPGRQVAAIVRLCDHLLKVHAGVARPSAADADGNFVTHAAQDSTVPQRKFDPEQNFRVQISTQGGITHGMGSPSLEEVVMRALRNDITVFDKGLINARGGDAFGTGIPGSGGFVRMEQGDATLENAMVDSRPNVTLGTGSTLALTGGNKMHLLLDGTATATTNLTLDLDGILWVGPNGTLDARGGFDGQDGHSLTITADGFALIEGRVLVNGADKLGPSEIAPFNQPPFVVGTGSGNGGNGGSFVFRAATGGFFWVPTIVTRGGDADSCPTGVPMPGGPGGDVEVRGLSNSVGEAVLMLVEGRENLSTLDQVHTGLPDYLPPPSPFNLMPVVLQNPTLASGTCGVDPFNDPNYVRPVSNERLPLGRAVTAANHQSGAPISLFHRGIWTSGGMGGNPPTGTFPGDGGLGGDIRIENQTTGYIRFRNGVQLFSGSGADRIASVISVSTCSGASINKFFNLPSGSLGGRGAFPGGDGGVGANAGNITVAGAIWPHITAAFVPTNVSFAPIIGFDLDNPNTSGGIQIGKFFTFVDEGFSTSSSRGSGGSPAGQATSFPGVFGPSGFDGTTNINGSQFYP